MRAKHAIFQPAAAVLSVALVIAGCSNNNQRARDDYQGMGQALDDLEPETPGAKPAEPASAEVPGVDVSTLDDRAKQRFAALLDRLPSPCGKAHSLRTSVTEDESCKRALFAARYVALLVDEDLDDLSIRAAYDGRYRDDERHEFDVSRAPAVGSTNARIQIVEFLDYG